MLGVKATLDGLAIKPNVPDSWDGYEVKRTYRGTKYTVKFKRGKENKILVNGVENSGCIINETDAKEALVEVVFS